MDIAEIVMLELCGIVVFAKKRVSSFQSKKNIYKKPEKDFI